MTTTFVTALNTISGRIAQVPESYLRHPVLKQHLVEVDDSRKPYDPNFYTPKTADAYRELHTREAEVEESDEPIADYLDDSDFTEDGD